MGKVIVISIVVALLGLALFYLVAWVIGQENKADARRQGLPLRGDLNARDEEALLEQLEGALEIMQHLRYPASLEDPDYLSEPSKTAITVWLNQYQPLMERINKRV